MVPVRHLSLFPVTSELECRLCLPGWILFNSVCYFFPTESSLGYKTWPKAREFCQMYGGDLAVINSTEKEVGDRHLNGGGVLGKKKKTHCRHCAVLMDGWMASRQTFEVSGVFETKPGKLSLKQMAT